MPQIFKTVDVLNRYRISRPTLRRWLAAGTFPTPMQVRNRNMWRAADIEAFELSRRLQ